MTGGEPNGGAPRTEVAQFTDELARAYECLALHVALNRRAWQAERPLDQISAMLDEAKGLLQFVWSAVDLNHDDRLLAQLAGARVAVGLCPLDGSGAAWRSALGQRGLAVLNPGDRHDHEVIVAAVEVDGQRAGLVAFGGYHGDEAGLTSFETQSVEAVAAFVGRLLSARFFHLQQERTFVGTLRALSGSLDAKDRYTRGHAERVALLARDLALASGKTAAEARRVELSGELHDIGKIGVPDRVLLKPGALTDDEFAEIKKHPRIGYDILQSVPGLADILPGVLHHHEKWNGRGYPDGLRGEQIPWMARVLALADTFDAMSSNRAYRPARTREHVLGEITRCAGDHFDPELASVFVRMDFSGFDALMENHKRLHVDVQGIAPAQAA